MKVSSYSVHRPHYPCPASTSYSNVVCTPGARRAEAKPPSTVRCCTLSVRRRRINKADGESMQLKSDEGGSWWRRQQLGKRWREYQGVSNWEGLLDPLDENLRREILRYGGFVDAAYKSFDFDPSSPSYATCKYPKRSLLVRCGIPGTGYRLTRHLTATSGISLPRWAPSSLVRSSWIGYVAVCKDRRVISHLGRRDVVVAFRGTATALEWLENLRASLTPADAAAEGDAMVERGFLSLYTSGASASLQQTVRAEVERLLQDYGGGDEPLSVTFTGHSLGAALATLAAYDLKEYLGRRAPLVTVMSFGGPRVGNRSFRCGLEHRGIKVLRIVNSDDLVTKLPGFVVDDGGAAPKPGWLRTPWVYAEVGEELRLSSRDSPDLPGGNGFNVATCHDLRTYLHLVENFVSSKCPFRATARKLLRGGAAHNNK